MRATRTNMWALTLVLLSCNSETKVPDDLLKKETLADILTDIHYAEAKVAKMNFRSMDSSVVVYNKLQHDIWAKYDVDSALYKKSYAFYASNPELMSGLYEIVTKRLKEPDTTAASQP